jgi:hypothetical protein
MSTDADYQILSTMIAPALFMTATGSLIISTNNRVSRVVDRFRVIIAAIERLTAPGSDIDLPQLRQTYLREELENLRGRSRRIRTASALLYFAFAMFVGSSLIIGLDVIFPIRVFNAPTLLSLIGVGCLFSAAINLFLEVRTAVRTVDREMSFLDNIQRERLAVGEREPVTSHNAGGNESHEIHAGRP